MLWVKICRMNCEGFVWAVGQIVSCQVIEHVAIKPSPELLSSVGVA